jgi:hypothetical protein
MTTSQATRKKRNKKMVADWNRGDSVTTISGRYRLSLGWTGVLLRRHGAKLPNSGRGIKVELDEPAVEDEYLRGGTVRSIADDLEVSYGKIYRLLQAREVPMRPRGGNRRS